MQPFKQVDESFLKSSSQSWNEDKWEEELTPTKFTVDKRGFRAPRRALWGRRIETLCQL